MLFFHVGGSWCSIWVPPQPSIDTFLKAPILKLSKPLPGMAKPAASKQKPKKSLQCVTKNEMEQLLADQASLILNAVAERLSAQERRFNIRLEKMERRFAKSLDELTKTLDRFLNRLTDMEEEFIFMKADLNRVKAVLREKLGVVLD
jgi:hypothetical protein